MCNHSHSAFISQPSSLPFSIFVLDFIGCKTVYLCVGIYCSYITTLRVCVHALLSFFIYSVCVLLFYKTEHVSPCFFISDV